MSANIPPLYISVLSEINSLSCNKNFDVFIEEKNGEYCKMLETDDFSREDLLYVKQYLSNVAAKINIQDMIGARIQKRLLLCIENLQSKFDSWLESYPPGFPPANELK